MSLNRGEVLNGSCTSHSHKEGNLSYFVHAPSLALPKTLRGKRQALEDLQAFRIKNPKKTVYALCPIGGPVAAGASDRSTGARPPPSSLSPPQSSSALPRRLWQSLALAVGVEAGDKWAELSKAKLSALAQQLTACDLQVRVSQRLLLTCVFRCRLVFVLCIYGKERRAFSLSPAPLPPLHRDGQLVVHACVCTYVRRVGAAFFSLLLLFLPAMRQTFSV